MVGNQYKNNIVLEKIAPNFLVKNEIYILKISFLD